MATSYFERDVKNGNIFDVGFSALGPVKFAEALASTALKHAVQVERQLGAGCSYIFCLSFSEVVRIEK